MDPMLILQLALASVSAGMKLVAEIKAQQQMSDQQLLDFATQSDAQTRAAAVAFIASVQA